MRKSSLNHTQKANVRARQLRSEMSISEKILWESIRKQKLGFAFKRQVPVGPYYLDFYCAKASLCVEVDGEQHKDRKPLDIHRDQYLRNLGIETIRVPSLDIHSLEPRVYQSWLDRIVQRCHERAGRSTPQPPSSFSPGKNEEGGE